MRYLVYIVLSLLSVFCFSQAMAQGVSMFGASRAQDTSKTRAQLVLSAYANSNQSLFLTVNSSGHVVLDTVDASSTHVGGYAISINGDTINLDTAITSGIYLRINDSTVSYVTPTQLATAIAGIPVLDTTSLSNRIDARVKYSDTTSLIPTKPFLTINYFKQGGNSFGTDAILGTNDNNILRFRTNGVERMRLLTNGRLLIGSVTDVGAELYVNGVTRLGASLITSTGALQLASVGHALGNGNIFFNSTATGTNVFSNGTDLTWSGATTSAIWRLRSFRGMIINDQNVISSPSSSSIFTLESTTRGVRFPKMTSTLRNAISTPDSGLMVYNTTAHQLSIYASQQWQDVLTSHNTGWGSWTDTRYTVSSPQTIAPATTDTLENSGTTSIINQQPIQATGLLYDSVAKKIRPITAGDAYIIRITFKAKSDHNFDYFVVALDIGGSIGVVSSETKVFAKAANTEQVFTVNIPIYAGDTFVANGGTILITTTTGTMSIYDVNYFINLTHKAR